MPIYEYKCEACGHEVESIQKISDPELIDCPHCSKPQLKKLMSASGFRLKGGGWYETDFKGKNRKNIVEGSESAGSDNSAVKSGETKAGEAKASDSKNSEAKDSTTKSSTTKDSVAASSTSATVEKSSSNKPADTSK